MLTITNARLFDGRRMLPGMPSLTLDGNRILGIGEQPGPGETVDVAGLTVMPGLITCHLHPDFYKFTLAQGLAGEPLGTV